MLRATRLADLDHPSGHGSLALMHLRDSQKYCGRCCLKEVLLVLPSPVRRVPHSQQQPTCIACFADQLCIEKAKMRVQNKWNTNSTQLACVIAIARHYTVSIRWCQSTPENHPRPTMQHQTQAHLPCDQAGCACRQSISASIQQPHHNRHMLNANTIL